MHINFRRAAALLIASGSLLTTPIHAQTQAVPAPAAVAGGVSLPDDYVIGAQDVLAVLFWREPDMSAEVTVRPDGKITLPLLGEMTVAGLKPEALRSKLQTAADGLLKEPNAIVIVRQINSRKVYITGQVVRSDAFPLLSPLSVVQLISLAGGLKDYADSENIKIMRTGPTGKSVFKFNFKDVSQGKSLHQDIQLQPGDMVVVP